MALRRSTITDSPWFWAYAFTMFGLLMLAVMGPKYVARQNQIERGYRGRQAVLSGGSAREVSNGGSERDAAAESPPLETEIPLQPLYFTLAAVAATAWFVFWRTRSSRQASRPDLSGARHP